MSRLLIATVSIILLLFSGWYSHAQVSNDNIEDRLQLHVNTVLNSHTRESTVQWKCLNQDLTRSCVKFHNDQWFEFTAPGENMFINVSGQDCKDIWGVQVIVFAGIPCEPETYELVTCYSEGNKDDIFIRLKNLTIGEKYLVNVDGYLHDLCSFEIELSDKPRGLPVNDAGRGEVSFTAGLYEAEITWKISGEDADDMRYYEIWKKSSAVYELAGKMDHQRNSFGSHQLQYSFTDSVKSAETDYMVVGVTPDDRLRIGDVRVVTDRQELARAPENRIDLELNFQKGDPVTIELWDAENDRQLDSYNFYFDPEKNERVSYGILRYRESGISFFKVIIRNRRTGKFDMKFYEK